MASQNTTQLPETELKCSRLVHPEDLVVGDDVVVASATHQLGTFLWCGGVDAFQFPPDEPIELTLLPYDDHFPQQVKSICLPFVFCERIDKKPVVHDLRQLRLVRLDRTFADAVRKAYKADAKSDEKQKRKSKKKKRKKKLK